VDLTEKTSRGIIYNLKGLQTLKTKCFDAFLIKSTVLQADLSLFIKSQKHICHY